MGMVKAPQEGCDNKLMLTQQLMVLADNGWKHVENVEDSRCLGTFSFYWSCNSIVCAFGVLERAKNYRWCRLVDRLGGGLQAPAVWWLGR